LGEEYPLESDDDGVNDEANSVSEDEKPMEKKRKIILLQNVDDADPLNSSNDGIYDMTPPMITTVPITTKTVLTMTVAKATKTTAMTREKRLKSGFQRQMMLESSATSHCTTTKMSTTIQEQIQLCPTLSVMWIQDL